MEILPYFSASLRAYQQYEKQTTTYGGQSFQQNDRRDQIELGFQNGGETSDLNFQYQYTKLDNYAYNAGLVQFAERQPPLQPRLRADAQLALGFARQLLRAHRGDASSPTSTRSTSTNS